MFRNSLYSVSEKQGNGNELLLKVHINGHHEVFSGHFPGNPVLPGVCMIAMMREILEEYTGSRLMIREASNIKFLAVLNPFDHPEPEIFIQQEKIGKEIRVKCNLDSGTTRFFSFSGTLIITGTI
ncbi:MAG: 3-hydroxyacyl-ACP dehydratase [Crocinitomicaceae bacterium]|nr:3-hydroxyacyl-ACP dehydratase [Crocinitomicaceae bacterium]